MITSKKTTDPKVGQAPSEKHGRRKLFSKKGLRTNRRGNDFQVNCLGKQKTPIGFSGPVANR
jgi:hypothetical protein